MLKKLLPIIFILSLQTAFLASANDLPPPKNPPPLIIKPGHPLYSKIGAPDDLIIIPREGIELEKLGLPPSPGNKPIIISNDGNGRPRMPFRARSSKLPPKWRMRIWGTPKVNGRGNGGVAGFCLMVAGTVVGCYKRLSPTDEVERMKQILDRPPF